MAIEPFVYFVLFLLVGMAMMFARWLKAEIEKKNREFDGERRIDWEQGDLNNVNQLDKNESVIVPSEGSSQNFLAAESSSQSLVVPKKWRRHIRASSTLGQGIVLMTILGPCRALDEKDNSPLF
ncbi:MAG: hypothetical protein NPIRA01_02180 [Nitrospirales bacterium]|nr:MAG: hypothetical protein NPIRA01_02180 [Nitrospirales bacterium]